jgi:hypothetical protein
MTTSLTKWLFTGLLFGLTGCGARSGVVAKSAPERDVYPSSPGASYAPSPAPASEAMKSGAPSAAAQAPADESSAGERPGLGTEWGETRYSHVRHTSFDRADGDHPAQVIDLSYNDREGARAMARYGDYRESGRAAVRAPGLGISVSLNDDAGRPLPAFFAGGHTYAVGEAGQRYTIVITNDTGMRIEAVASVDGLDVLDGKSADFGKRGYLVPAWSSVEIDGFRQTNDHVAAFRFGSVRDSYAARTGTDRNVGVIGVALFTPREARGFPWTDREIERRKSADPFPGSYASPPPPRY